MHKIVQREVLSENVVKLVISAERISKSRKAGQFVIVKLGEKGERIPLTIADSDPEKGTITLIIQEVGLTSHKFFMITEGEEVTDIVGPLGLPTDVKKVGTIIAAGGGVGIAPLYPIAKAYKADGTKLIVILAARSKDLIILEKEMREFADEVMVYTDDGSAGTKGLVTAGVESVINREKVDEVVTIGPAVMMKFVALLTKKYNICFPAAAE